MCNIQWHIYRKIKSVENNQAKIWATTVAAAAAATTLAADSIFRQKNKQTTIYTIKHIPHCVVQ